MLTCDIAVGRNADGRMEVFVRGTDNALWHKWQTTPNGGWSGWVSEGGVLTSDIAVGAERRRPHGGVRPRHRQCALAQVADHPERRLVGLGRPRAAC